MHWFATFLKDNMTSHKNFHVTNLSTSDSKKIDVFIVATTIFQTNDNGNFLTNFVEIFTLKSKSLS
jgi:hypothetical protein